MLLVYNTPGCLFRPLVLVKPFKDTSHLICHSTSLSLYFIIFNKDNFVKVSPYKWLLLKLGEFFLMKILQKDTQGPTKLNFLHINK